MNRLKEFANYLLDQDERKASILMNKMNYKVKEGWRLTDYQSFDYDLMNPENPTDRITTDAKLEEFQKALYYLDKLQVGANCYIVDKDLGLLPFDSVREALENSMGLDQFCDVYLRPIFQDNEEWLEDFHEAALFLDACLGLD